MTLFTMSVLLNLVLGGFLVFQTVNERMSRMKTYQIPYHDTAMVVRCRKEVKTECGSILSECEGSYSYACVTANQVD